MSQITRESLVYDIASRLFWARVAMVGYPQTRSEVLESDGGSVTADQELLHRITTQVSRSMRFSPEHILGDHRIINKVTEKVLDSIERDYNLNGAWFHGDERNVEDGGAARVDCPLQELRGVRLCMEGEGLEVNGELVVRENLPAAVLARGIPENTVFIVESTRPALLYSRPMIFDMREATNVGGDLHILHGVFNLMLAEGEDKRTWWSLIPNASFVPYGERITVYTPKGRTELYLDAI